MLEIQKKLYDEDDMRLAIEIEHFYQLHWDSLKKHEDFYSYDDMIRLCEEIKQAYLENYDNLSFAQQGYIVEYAQEYLWDKYWRFIKCHD